MPPTASEWGGVQKAARHESEQDRWTEDYQADIYRH
jgi:hypothetical protein